MKKIDFVRDLIKEENSLNKRLLASLFCIARSGFQYTSKLQVKDTQSHISLLSVHETHPWYGHRRISRTLSWSNKKTIRLMKKFKIVAKQRRSKIWIKPGDIHQEDMHGKITIGGKIENHLATMCPIAPHVVWRSDFTHIIYKNIHLYLATILDDFTKEVVGYALSYHHTKEFILTAIQDALKKTSGVTPQYFHSDQGSEYKSHMILEFLFVNKITVSMSSKGSPWQNGAQESYYGKLKLELGKINDYESIESLILVIHRQIHYYNTKRLHTSLKDTPLGFRKKYEIKQLLLVQHKMKESSDSKK